MVVDDRNMGSLQHQMLGFLKRYTVYLLIGGGGFIVGYCSSKDSNLAWVGVGLMVLGYLWLMQLVKD